MISKILLYEIAKQTRKMLKSEQLYNQGGQIRHLSAKIKARTRATDLLKQLEQQEFEN